MINRFVVVQIYNGVTLSLSTETKPFNGRGRGRCISVGMSEIGAYQHQLIRSHLDFDFLAAVSDEGT